jgi:3-oxoacyl-[acyl-carrier protein] reductase
MILSEQTILLTGGAGAIGEFLVSVLYTQAKKLVVIDKDTEKLEKLKQQFENISVYCADLVQVDEVDRTIASIFQTHPVSVLVNNAGLIHSEPLFNILKLENKKHSIEAWDKTIKANLYATFFVTANVVEQMVTKRIKGVIINISSISATGNIGQTAYSAAKSGIEAMTVTWSKELGIFGIRSVAIAPGFFDTTSTRVSLSEANLKKWERAVPLNRLGNLAELYSALRFVIENDYFNGRTLAIDGGLKI